MARRRQCEYDYNSKPRNWRRDKTRAIWVNTIMLVGGLGFAAYIVYLAITK